MHGIWAPPPLTSYSTHATPSTQATPRPRSRSPRRSNIRLTPNPHHSDDRPSGSTRDPATTPTPKGIHVATSATATEPHRRPYNPYTLPDHDHASHIYGRDTFNRILHYLHHQCDQLTERNTPMLRYVARILTTAGIFAKDLEALDQWIHSDRDDAINGYKSTSYFSLYIPRLQHKQRVEHIPHRRNQTDTQHGTVHVFASHATEEGNLLNLLQSGRFKPSTNHSPTAQGFYAQGYETTGKLIYDAWHTARVIDKTCQMPKNRAGIILHCMAWGTGKKFLQGGEQEGEKFLAANHGVVKHDKGKCYIIHPDNCVIRGIAWEGQATPPQSFL